MKCHETKLTKLEGVISSKFRQLIGLITEMEFFYIKQEKKQSCHWSTEPNVVKKSIKHKDK